MLPPAPGNRSVPGTPSRPGELHPEPLTDPDMKLSPHPARATPRKPCRASPRQEFLRFPVDSILTWVTCPLRSTGITPLPHCRVGGGALTRWPPSAAQTARTLFAYAAFTKTQSCRDANEGVPASYSDNFSRANENPLAAPWTVVGVGSMTPEEPLALVSDAVQSTVSNIPSVMYYNEVTPADQFSQVTVAGITGSRYDQVGVMVRAAYCDQTFYAFYADSTFVYIDKRVAGNSSNLVEGVQAVGNGDVLKLTVVGTTLTGYVNGTTVRSDNPSIGRSLRSA